MLVPFFFVSSVPVFADYDVDTYRVPEYQVLAYEFWNANGFNLTQSFNNSTNIAVPQYTINSGNTSWSLICNEDVSYPANGAACYYRNNSTGQVYGTWEQNTSLAHTEVEQNISIQGVEIPWLSGNYTHINGFDSLTKAAYIPPNNDLYISFISNISTYNSTPYENTAVTANNHVRVWANEVVQYFIDFEVISVSQVNAAYQYTYKFHNNDSVRHWINIDIPRFNSNTKIIPIYLGSGDNIDDSVKQVIHIPTTTENYLGNINNQISGLGFNVSQQNNLITQGNTNSQSAQTNLGIQNNELSSTVNQINSLETTYNNDLNSALNGIDLDNDLVSHTGFTNAALWVSAQFNRMISGTPFELVMMFSLVTGLALVLIGKMRA